MIFLGALESQLYLNPGVFASNKNRVRSMYSPWVLHWDFFELMAYAIASMNQNYGPDFLALELNQPGNIPSTCEPNPAAFNCTSCCIGPLPADVAILLAIFYLIDLPHLHASRLSRRSSYVIDVPQQSYVFGH